MFLTCVIEVHGLSGIVLDKNIDRANSQEFITKILVFKRVGQTLEKGSESRAKVLSDK